MSMSGDDAYVLAMDYVDETLEGGGALKGADGKSAYDLWLEAGNVGSEQDFLDSLKGADGTMSFDDLTEEQKESLKGADGKSAYQYAQDGGYIGTETEFTTNIARSGVISKELEVERARIDNLTTLKDGSTTGDAELIDARIDKDGNTHVNVGKHIRTVTSQLSNEIGDYAKIKADEVSLFRLRGYRGNITGNLVESSNYKSTEILPIDLLRDVVVRIYTVYSDGVSYCSLYGEQKNFIGSVEYLNLEINSFDVNDIISNTPDVAFISFTHNVQNNIGLEIYNKILRETKEDIQYQIDNLSRYVDYTNRIKPRGVPIANSDIGTRLVDTTVKSVFSHVYIECREGDTFEICGLGDSSAYRLWCFIDVDRVQISRAMGTSSANDCTSAPITLTAPDNARWLVCNLDMSVSNSYVRKKRDYAIEDDKLGERIDKLTPKTREHKIALPKWCEVHPFKDYSGIYTYTDAMNNSGFGFSNWYELFNGLCTEYSNVGLEEIDIGEQYNLEKSENTPSYISDVVDGKLVMYHVAPPETDESGFDVKHKKLKVVLVSGVHGSERKSIWDNYILLKQLCESTLITTDSVNHGRAIINIRNFIDLYVIPMVNVSGIDVGSRNNKNPNGNVNLNRDFSVNNWHSVADSGDTPNTQWETRVISYILDTIKPDVVIDHHTSSGDNRKYEDNPSGGELGKFISWGDSDIASIMTVIEENLMEITPYIKYAFPEKLGNTNFVFGHTENITEESLGVGTLPRYAYQNGAISLTHEAVQHLRWTPTGTDRIFGFSDSDEIQLASINYFCYINMIMKVLDIAKEWINNSVDYKYV